MLVREVVREGHVPAELLKASLALGAGPVGVDHAADRGDVSKLVLGDCRAHLRDTADDLVAWDAGGDSGHDPAPLVTDLMEIGVADAAEENVNLYVVFCWIAPHDRGGGKRRCRIGGGVSLRLVHRYLVHNFNKYASGVLRYARYAIDQNKRSGLVSSAEPETWIVYSQSRPNRRQLKAKYADCGESVAGIKEVESVN